MAKQKDDAFLSKIVRSETNWFEENEYAIAHEEEIRANTKIVLRIRQYMKERNMKQKDLAAKLGVTPQYINKLLHGHIHNISVGTAVKYGRLLNIKLVEIPESANTMCIRQEFSRQKIEYNENILLTNYSVQTDFRGNYRTNIKNKPAYGTIVS